MLDGDGGDIGKFQNCAQRRVGVQDVVEGKLFALKLLGARDGRAAVALGAVERGALMRVFAVAHVLDFRDLNVDAFAPSAAVFCSHRVTKNNLKSRHRSERCAGTLCKTAGNASPARARVFAFNSARIAS